MKFSIKSTSGLSALALATALSASSAVAAGWRQAHVRSVGPRPDADSGIDLTCAPQRAGDDPFKVLVVSVRTGKSHYWRAFNIADDANYVTGDDVIIDVVHCVVAPLPSPDPAASSAP